MNTDYNLKEITLAAFEELILATDQQVSMRESTDHWSAKEILGHLIDTATNHHGRFLQAQLQNDMIFADYDAKAWVELQEYQMQNWQDLLITWRQLNMQIAYLLYITEEDARNKEYDNHNLHQVAFNAIPEDEPATLAYLMEDYVLRIRHHLGQIRTILSQA
jgi:hypothetical protein